MAFFSFIRSINIVDIADCLPSLRCLQSTLLCNHSERQLLNDDEDAQHKIIPEEDDLSDLLHRMDANNNNTLNGESQTITLSGRLLKNFNHVYGELRFLSEVIHSDESKQKIGIIMKFSLLKIGESFRGINREIENLDQSDPVRLIIKKAPLLNRALQETVLSRNDGIAHDVLGYEDEPHYNTIINQTIPLCEQIEAILVLSYYQAPPPLVENGTISIHNYQNTHREVVESYLQLGLYDNAKCHVKAAIDEIDGYRTQEDMSETEIKSLETNQNFLTLLHTSLNEKIIFHDKKKDTYACKAELENSLKQIISHGINITGTPCFSGYDENLVDPNALVRIGSICAQTGQYVTAIDYFERALASLKWIVDEIRSRDDGWRKDQLGPALFLIQDILIYNATCKANLHNLDAAQDDIDTIMYVDHCRPLFQCAYYELSILVKLMRRSFTDRLGAIANFMILYSQLPTWEAHIKAKHSVATYLLKRELCIEYGIKCFEGVTEKMLDFVPVSSLEMLLSGILWLAKESPDFWSYFHTLHDEATGYLIRAGRYLIKRKPDQYFPVANRSEIFSLALFLIRFINLYKPDESHPEIYGYISSYADTDVAHQDNILDMFREAITKAVEKQDCDEHIIRDYLMMIWEVFGRENDTALVDTFNYVDGVVAPHINDSTRFRKGLNQFKDAVRKKIYSFDVDTDKENTINTVSRDHDNVSTAVTSCTEIDIARKDSPKQHLANLGLMTRPLYRFTNALVSKLRNQIPSGTFWADVRPNDSTDKPTASLMFSCRKTFEADVHRVLDGDHEGVTETQRCYGTF